MHDGSTDSRVTARENGGWDVTTSQGTYHVLDSEALGWGIFTGQNLDLVFTDGGPVLGAAEPQGLIDALLNADDGVTNAQASAEQTDDDTDTDGM